ncbi:MAG: DUF1573 domain-containing protein [Sumerlaeia bacterium]
MKSASPLFLVLSLFAVSVVSLSALKLRPADQSVENNESQPEATSNAIHSGNLVIFPKVVDLGVGIPETGVLRKIVFRNTGRENIEISSVRTNCPCHMTNWSEAVLPAGGEMALEVDFTVYRGQYVAQVMIAAVQDGEETIHLIDAYGVGSYPNEIEYEHPFFERRPGDHLVLPIKFTTEEKPEGWDFFYKRHSDKESLPANEAAILETVHHSDHYVSRLQMTIPVTEDSVPKYSKILITGKKPGLEPITCQVVVR